MVLPGPVNCTVMGSSDGDKGMVLPLESALFYVIKGQCKFPVNCLEKNHSSLTTKKPLNRLGTFKVCLCKLMWQSPPLSYCGALAAFDAHTGAVIWHSRPHLCMLSRNAGSSKDSGLRGSLVSLQRQLGGGWWFVF